MNITKKMIILFSSLILLFSISNITPVSAQSDGVIDQCTFYNPNGPIHNTECEKRIRYLKEANNSPFAKKFNKCLLASGFSITPSLVIPSLAMSQAGLLATYGSAFMGCLIS